MGSRGMKYMNTKQLGVTALQDLNECPCAERMVLFQACVA